jgi:hypothetical protein
MQGETMKSAIRSATLVAFFVAALPVALGFAVKAQTSDTPNAELPGGHPHSDYYKNGNGDHGNDGGNGG